MKFPEIHHIKNRTWNIVIEIKIKEYGSSLLFRFEFKENYSILIMWDYLKELIHR
jgi:hypothetical protein